MARKKIIPLPTQGDAFVVPLDDGRYSVCRVILDASSDVAKQWDAECVLVACSKWIGKEIPRPDDPALRPILLLTHHSWAGKPEMAWITDPVPADFMPLGQIPPTADELATECGTFSGWASMALQPLLQWRWDHDRGAVLEEDRENDAKAVAQRAKAAAERRAYLASVTLDDLLNHEFFPRWEEYPPAEAVRASRDLMKATVRSLIGLGESATEEERKAALQSCIESFNDLDEKLEFIETVEREDICEEFEAIVIACGLGRYEDLADEWRDW